MRLYRVVYYEEIYVQAIYKPSWFDDARSNPVTYTDNPIEFVGDLLPIGEVIAAIPVEDIEDIMGDVRHVYEEHFLRAAITPENIANLIADTAGWASHMPQHLWEVRQSVLHAWVATPEKTPQFLESCWYQMGTILQWVNQQGPAHISATQFWNQVRFTAGWNNMFSQYFEIYRKNLPADQARVAAMNAADHICRETMKAIGRPSKELLVSFQEFVSYWLSNAFATARSFLAGSYLVGALIGAAILSLAVLFYNPTEMGLRRRRYLGHFYFLRYRERLWWADIVGRSLLGYNVYYVGAEVPALITAVSQAKGAGIGKPEVWDLMPYAGGETKIGLLWDATFSKKAYVDFIGFLDCMGGSYYRLQEGYLPFEKAPEVWVRDRFGNLTQATPAWYRDIMGEVSLKPVELWFQEDAVPFVEFEQDIDFVDV